MGLAGYRRRRLVTLSGGEKQRVALAAVLAMGPRMLVLDEPSANLDPQATAELFDLLRRLAADRRHTIVIIEHKLDELIEWIDSVLVLDRDGRLLFRGSPEDGLLRAGRVLSSAGSVAAADGGTGRGACARRGWEVPGSPLGVADTVAALAATPGLVDRLGRRRRRAPRRRPPDRRGARRGEPAAPRRATSASATERLARRRRADAASRCRSSRGRFLAIAGANGAGKTTLAALLSGVLEPPAGARVPGRRRPRRHAQRDGRQRRGWATSSRIPSTSS